MISQIDQTMYRLKNLDSLQQKLSYQSSTGKKLQDGSDDSVLYSRELVVDDKIRTFEGLKTQIERTKIQNDSSDSAMEEIKKIMESINAELIKANTDTTSSDGLKAIALNIAGMKENLYDLANTQVEGEYVFSGSNSAIKPFEKNSAGEIIYQGDNKLRKVPVEEGSYRERGINGFDSMMYTSSSALRNENLTFNQNDRILDQDGNEWKLNSPTNDTLTKYDLDGNVTAETLTPVNLDPVTNTFSVTIPNTFPNGTKFEAKTTIFNMLDNVVNALNKVDSVGNPITDAQSKELIAKGLDSVKKSFDDLNIAHAELGSRNKIFLNSLDRVSSKLTQLNILSQELGAANLTEVAVKAKALELTYTALYSTISKTNQLSLVNFIN
ncbi:flagellar hook-associated protein FlgL [Arcobacter aquimarinus]|uniref:Distal flagellar hook-filament junction protein n=1 Tax=Arcobacter aquimarinus TaxID=1315211 RepID=A0AAE7E2B8_9BACT|nr:flagellar hook-associated protein FlgL [Arcobacter aquimarinus]QKE26797.1 distal flagellar hook-filament junction protein [Arcobacter aquimarinus]RXI32170.1 flagellar hook-associated protein 3 [Arcobacter aquimarinus]